MVKHWWRGNFIEGKLKFFWKISLISLIFKKNVIFILSDLNDLIILFIQWIVYEALLSTKLPLYLKEHLKNAASQNPVDENKAIWFIFPSYMQIQVGKERDKNAFVSIIQEDA